MEEIVVKRKVFTVIENRFQSEKMNEFLCEFKNKKYIVRKFSNFDDFAEMLYRYKKVYSYGIYTPLLRVKDKTQFVLVFDIVEGDNIASLLANADLSDDVFEKLFKFYRYARANQIELNYLPENFVLSGKKLYYTSLEIFPQNKEINLENYGLEYWIPSKKAFDHLSKLGYNMDKKRVLSIGEANKKIVLLSLYNW